MQLITINHFTALLLTVRNRQTTLQNILETSTHNTLATAQQRPSNHP